MYDAGVNRGEFGHQSGRVGCYWYSGIVECRFLKQIDVLVLEREHSAVVRKDSVEFVVENFLL